MLQLKVPLGPEGWNEAKEEFVEPEYQIIELEHSLASISKWESKWCKTFLSNNDKTYEETMDYIKCMMLNPDDETDVIDRLTQKNITEIYDYINAPMTAVSFRDDNKKGHSRDKITSELIYYWMSSANIPLEWENRHLNKLISLIRVYGMKNSPPKSMSQSDVMRRNTALNAARRKQHNSKG